MITNLRAADGFGVTRDERAETSQRLFVNSGDARQFFLSGGFLQFFQRGRFGPLVILQAQTTLQCALFHCRQSFRRVNFRQAFEICVHNDRHGMVANHRARFVARQRPHRQCPVLPVKSHHGLH